MGDGSENEVMRIINQTLETYAENVEDGKKDSV